MRKGGSLLAGALLAKMCEAVRSAFDGAGAQLKRAWAEILDIERRSGG